MLCVKKMRDMTAKRQDGYKKKKCNACESKTQMIYEKNWSKIIKKKTENFLVSIDQVLSEHKSKLAEARLQKLEKFRLIK